MFEINDNIFDLEKERDEFHSYINELKTLSDKAKAYDRVLNYIKLLESLGPFRWPEICIKNEIGMVYHPGLMWYCSPFDENFDTNTKEEDYFTDLRDENKSLFEIPSGEFYNRYKALDALMKHIVNLEKLIASCSYALI